MDKNIKKLKSISNKAIHSNVQDQNTFLTLWGENIGYIKLSTKFLGSLVCPKLSGKTMVCYVHNQFFTLVFCCKEFHYLNLKRHKNHLQWEKFINSISGLITELRCKQLQSASISCCRLINICTKASRIIMLPNLILG